MDKLSIVEVTFPAESLSAIPTGAQFAL